MKVIINISSNIYKHAIDVELSDNLIRDLKANLKKFKDL